ncbi:hypothetical protein B5D80_08870 [Micromonospora wenchangensis]|uniref:Uncharacterized protein n=1 Tax=Micromonospora wenchangensis TaxID=1185415 RepID=A0A2D0AXF9_9ACTN|nr:hypothetical protein [Micromonospora wenchangensis]OWV09502.1 hypothetical protein B5D80_08870 [Micromonospora wenchangensis]
MTSDIPGTRCWVMSHRPSDAADSRSPGPRRTVLDPISGRPWLTGWWPQLAFHQIDVPGFRMVLLGPCPLSPRLLTEQANQAVRRHAFGALARLPGSYLTFVRAPYGTYVAGDVAGVCRLWLDDGTAGTRPGPTAVLLPEATGALLYDDGAVRHERYWTPPVAEAPATITGPLVAHRLRMAVRCRLDLLGSGLQHSGRVARRLAGGEAVGVSTSMLLSPTGLDEILGPAPTPHRTVWRNGTADRLRLARAQSSPSSGSDDLCVHRPLLDAHVLEAALATRERDVRRGTLRRETMLVLDQMSSE